MSLVLLTRTAEDSKTLSQDLEKLGICSLIEPMLILKQKKISKLDISTYAGIIFTSHYAAAALNIQTNIPVYAVGRRTGDTACANGFFKIEKILPTVADLIDALKTKSAAAGPFLYYRGAHVTTDLPRALPHLKIDEVIAYDMESPPAFSPEFLGNLHQGRIGVISFFSRRTAENFMNLVEKSQSLQALHAVKVLCISKGVLECVKGVNWADFHVADTPDRQAMIEKLNSMGTDRKGSA